MVIKFINHLKFYSKRPLKYEDIVNIQLIMKNKIAPINVEHDFPENQLLVSKTNPKGIITYCNTAFANVSGYSELELLGQQHSIVRHPEMPRVIFKIMWEMLESNQEFNGYIKNLAKDGSYYWVFTNITPSLAPNTDLLGYYSVRRKPETEKLNYIKNLYIELSDIEKESETKDTIDESRKKIDSILNGRELGYDEFILTL